MSECLGHIRIVCSGLLSILRQVDFIDGSLDSPSQKSLNTHNNEVEDDDEGDRSAPVVCNLLLEAGEEINQP